MTETTIDPGTEMEALMQSATAADTDTVENYRQCVAAEAAGTNDTELKTAGAAAMAVLKISGKAYSFDVQQYRRFMNLQNEIGKYDELELEAAVETARQKKDQADAALKAATAQFFSTYDRYRSCVTDKLAAGKLQKENLRLFGDMPDRETLRAHYSIMGWPT